MSHAHVLIVDDDPALLQALPQAINLRMQHVDVDVSDSADKALQLVQQQSYDAIVSDIKMPGMDGIELIERLQIFCPDTPTLLITGHGEHTLAVQALRVGAYDFIQKPIDREYFVTALRRAIQIYQLRRRIADQQKALERHADELERAVEERTRDLVEANAAKDVFLSMASHELKTPLTTIKGLSQMLYRLVEQGEKIDLKSVELLANAARRMEILVNDILNTSLVDAAVFSLHLQAENLSALCHETLAAYSAEMGTSLRLEIVESDLPVNVDRERICQVLLNLLSNARKYSPPRSPVTIRVSSRDQQAAISVTDQGVGIPPEHLEHIFDRFYRSPEVDVQTGSSVGVGLGLYIARKIVEQHNGQLSAISTPGKGSTFTIALPLLLPEGLQQTAKLSAEQS